MAKKNKDLPKHSDVNRKTDDERFQQQEEFDNKGMNERENESRARNERHNEQMRDSQQGNERMVPESKKKESPRDYQEDRKLPQIKK
ncbi:MAG TPA: hypothetical protein VD993_13935 [Chitinophagaceae bacterium]|nr:hypothetical protein [Chitinophagaceae bacterium]